MRVVRVILILYYTILASSVVVTRCHTNTREAGAGKETLSARRRIDTREEGVGKEMRRRAADRYGCATEATRQHCTIVTPAEGQYKGCVQRGRHDRRGRIDTNVGKMHSNNNNNNVKLTVNSLCKHVFFLATNCHFCS